MRRLIRTFVVECVALYLVSQIASGLEFQNGIHGLMITGLALSLATLLIRPIINLLLLPINILTFGLFRWVSQALTIFLVDLALPQFTIQAFNFPGYVSTYLDLPAISFSPGIASYMAFSFVIAFVGGLIYWLVK